MSDPRIRVVHCSPDTPAVTVALERASAGPDTTRPIEFGEHTGYLVTDSGEVGVDVIPASGPDASIVHTSQEVDSDELWTLVVVGRLEDNATGAIHVEDTTAPSGAEVAHLRFINAIPEADVAPLGLRFTEAVVDGDHVVSEKIAFGQHGTYRPVEPGRHRYQIGADTGQKALDSPGEHQVMDHESHLSGEGTFDAGHAYTVIAAGQGAPSDLGFIVLEDTTPEARPG